MLELCVYFLIWRIRKGRFKGMVISVNQKFNEIIFKFIEKLTAKSLGHPGRNTCRSPIPLNYRKRRLNWGGGGFR